MSDDKPSQNQFIGSMMVKLMNTFSELPAFSYVFLAADGTCATGPSLASIVDLASCALEHWDYEGPHPTSQFKPLFAEAEKRRQEIIDIVQEHVRTLRDSGTSFILCWHVHGEKQPHVEWYGDYTEKKVFEDLFHLLANEVEDYPIS